MGIGPATRAPVLGSKSEGSPEFDADHKTSSAVCAASEGAIERVAELTQGDNGPGLWPCGRL
jgi:hypothetical protein